MNGVIGMTGLLLDTNSNDDRWTGSLARALSKDDPDFASMRLVLMPSYGQRGDSQLARDIGIAAYLTKPVRQSQLFDCLATVMGDEIDPAIATAPTPVRLVTRHSLEETKLHPAA